MCTLHHEAILETIYDEFIDEATQTGNITMYTQKEIESIVYQRFEELCQ